MGYQAVFALCVMFYPYMYAWHAFSSLYVLARLYLSLANVISLIVFILLYVPLVAFVICLSAFVLINIIRILLLKCGCRINHLVGI